MEDAGITIPVPPPSPSGIFIGYKSLLPSSKRPCIKLARGPAETPLTPRKKVRTTKGIPARRTVNASRKAVIADGPSLHLQTVENWTSGLEDSDMDAITYASPTGTPTRVPRSTQTQNYELYVDAVLAGAAEFIQISPEFFVVQGWDGKSGSTTVGMSMTRKADCTDNML